MARRRSKRGKPCEQVSLGCQRDAIRGERFCPRCRARLLWRMKAEGFLAREGESHSNYRRPEAREDVRLTKYGPEDG